LLVSLKNRQGN